MVYIKGRYVYNVGMYASYICICMYLADGSLLFFALKVSNNHLPSYFLLATLLQFYSIELLLLCGLSTSHAAVLWLIATCNVQLCSDCATCHQRCICPCAWWGVAHLHLIDAQTERLWNALPSAHTPPGAHPGRPAVCVCRGLCGKFMWPVGRCCGCLPCIASPGASSGRCK